MHIAKGQDGILLVEQYFDWARESATIILMDRGAVVLSGAREAMNETEVAAPADGVRSARRSDRGLQSIGSASSS